MMYLVFPVKKINFKMCTHFKSNLLAAKAYCLIFLSEEGFLMRPDNKKFVS